MFAQAVWMSMAETEFVILGHHNPHVLLVAVPGKTVPQSEQTVAGPGSGRAHDSLRQPFHDSGVLLFVVRLPWYLAGIIAG